MNNLDIYCVTNKRIQFLENSSYKLCSVGKNFSHKNYQRSDIKQNIFDKEKYYSELTFHYWYWKNLLPQEKKDQWVGFCQKRRYWVNYDNINEISKKNINEYLFYEVPQDWENYEAIICKPISVSGVKKMKLFKRGFKNLLKNPGILFNKNKQNLYLHFDMHHGSGNLKKAILELDESNRTDFEIFMKKNTSFNPHIMFITKPEIMNNWFNELFKWLEKCEKIFNFDNLKGYDTERLFAYLSERYLSYWFKKHLKYKEENWIQLDNF